MRSWLDKQPDQTQEQITRRFTGLMLYDNLGALSDKRVYEPTVTYSDLYAFISGQSREHRTRIIEAVMSHPPLRKTYDALLREHARAYGPRVSAASSGSRVEKRIYDSFSIELRSSRARPDQIYVQLMLNKIDQELPGQIICHGKDGQIVSQTLPSEIEGAYQWLESIDSDLVKMLRDRETEIFLC